MFFLLSYLPALFYVCRCQNNFQFSLLCCMLTGSLTAKPFHQYQCDIAHLYFHISCINFYLDILGEVETDWKRLLCLSPWLNKAEWPPRQGLHLFSTVPHPPSRTEVLMPFQEQFHFLFGICHYPPILRSPIFGVVKVKEEMLPLISPWPIITCYLGAAFDVWHVTLPNLVVYNTAVFMWSPYHNPNSGHLCLSLVIYVHYLYSLWVGGS